MPRARKPSGGLPPAILALGSVVVLVLGGIVVTAMLNPKEPAAKESDAAQAEEPIGDPFAGLAPESPPPSLAERRRQKQAADAARAAGGAAPTPVAEPSAPVAEPESAAAAELNRIEDPKWKAALETAREARTAFNEGKAQRGAGNPAGFVEKAREALALYEQAFEQGRVLRDRLKLQLGSEHPDYLYVERECARWSQEILDLKKTVRP